MPSALRLAQIASAYGFAMTEVASAVCFVASLLAMTAPRNDDYALAKCRFAIATYQSKHPGLAMASLFSTFSKG